MACAGKTSIAELCRRERIAESMYYSWSKEFLEASKRRLAGETARAATTDEVEQLRREAQDLKEVVAEQALEFGCSKSRFDRGWGRPNMRLPASEKLEIIRLVEQSHPRPDERWRCSASSRRRSIAGMIASDPARRKPFEDKPSKPNRVWNPIPEEVRQRVVTMALEQPELSPRELATRFTRHDQLLRLGIIGLSALEGP